MNQQEQMTEPVEPSVMAELAELRHFKDSVLGLWCVDQDPKDKPAEWVREHAFQLT